jgi:hypothetical protein
LIIHTLAKLLAAKRSSFIKHHAFQVFIEGDLAYFIGIKGEVMTFFCFFRIEFEKIDGPSAAAAVPAIGKEYATDIGKDGFDGGSFFHLNEFVSDKARQESGIENWKFG